MRALLKSLNNDPHGTVLTALLVERILKIRDITRQDMKENPKGWENGFVDKELFVRLFEIIDANFED